MRMMAAQEERRAQEQRAMMAAIAELVQTQSPAKPASRRARAKNKKPSASPARAPKKNRTTPSPARAPKKKRTPTPTPARALQKNRKKTQTLPGKKKLLHNQLFAGPLGNTSRRLSLQKKKAKFPAMTTPTTVATTTTTTTTTTVTTATMTHPARSNQRVVPVAKNPPWQGRQAWQIWWRNEKTFASENRPN